MHQREVALALLWGCLIISAGCDGRMSGASAPPSRTPETAVSPPSTLPLVPSESRLSLGQVAPGGRKECAFHLRNQSSAIVEIAGIETSCDCLKVDLTQGPVGPGEEVSGRASLDLRKDPRFTGKLGINIRGTGKSGERVFALVVEVIVEE